MAGIVNYGRKKFYNIGSRSHSFNIGSQNRTKEKPQDPPIEHDLYVTLEDLFKVSNNSSSYWN
jgi:hypothetical protein